MKQIELLTDKRAIDATKELLYGANKLKDAKKYFECFERKPVFLQPDHQNDYFEFMDVIDVKIFEALQEINKCIAFMVMCELDDKIND